MKMKEMSNWETGGESECADRQEGTEKAKRKKCKCKKKEHRTQQRKPSGFSAKRDRWQLIENKREIKRVREKEGIAVRDGKTLLPITHTHIPLRVMTTAVLLQCRSAL